MADIDPGAAGGINMGTWEKIPGMLGGLEEGITNMVNDLTAGQWNAQNMFKLQVKMTTYSQATTTMTNLMEGIKSLVQEVGRSLSK